MYDTFGTVIYEGVPLDRKLGSNDDNLVRLIQRLFVEFRTKALAESVAQLSAV